MENKETGLQAAGQHWSHESGTRKDLIQSTMKETQRARGKALRIGGTARWRLSMLLNCTLKNYHYITFALKPQLKWHVVLQKIKRTVFRISFCSTCWSVNWNENKCNVNNTTLLISCPSHGRQHEATQDTTSPSVLCRKQKWPRVADVTTSCY